MTDTTQDQQFRTAAAKRRMRLRGTRYLRWTALEVLPPLKAALRLRDAPADNRRAARLESPR